jgi:hypothetical protein
VHAELTRMLLDVTREGLPRGRVCVDHEVERTTELVVLGIGTRAIPANVTHAEHRTHDVGHRRGPELDRAQLVRRTVGHEREHRLQVRLRVVVGEDRLPQSAGLREIATRGTEEKSGGGRCVLHVLGVGDPVTIRVPTPGPP